MSTVLIPIPNAGFDPTESGVPWKLLQAAGHTLVFATPDGKPGQADPRMVTGQDLGLVAGMMMADANGQSAYRAMEASAAFRKPLPYAEIRSQDFDALLLPGGHAKPMRPYLESEVLQQRVSEFFEQNKPVAAICHGVLLAARSKLGSGKSVLFGKKTTGLTRWMELSAWGLTCAWLGNYYRTYSTTVEGEVTATLAHPADFLRGPLGLTRYSPEHLGTGFTVLDGRYLSARWPGDAHRFGSEFAALLQKRG
jgi:protease I